MSKRIGVLAAWPSVVTLAILVGPAQAQSPAPQAKSAAVVNGEAIPEAELQQILERQPPSPVPMPEAEKRARRQAALDMLIDDVLMRQFLTKNAPPVSAADVNKELAELDGVLAQQKKTRQEFLKDTGQTEEQLRADIASRLQWKVYVINRLPDQVIHTYYDTNKVFFDKVFVRASHILLRVSPNAPDADRQAARAKLQSIRDEIVAGKIKFDQAAKTYSQCPSNANGGDIGLFPYKFAVQEPFARAAFSMKVGDVSDIIQTEFGYHILMVTDRTKGETSTFENVKDMVRDVYAQEVELYQGVVAEQRKSARIEVPTP